MNILITGGTGFIGHNLIEKLLQNKGYKIYCLGRKKGEAKYLNKNIKWITTNLSNKGFTKNIPKENFDTVIHLAQSNHYRNFPEKSSDIFEINVVSTYELLNWSRINNVKKFIFSSTGSVYKDSREIISEKNKCDPSGFYGVSKMIAENLVSSYTCFFETNILRIFGVYGPHQKKMLIPSIINKIKKNEKIILAKNDGIFLSPLYISDCIEMIKLVIEKKNQSGIFNISGNEHVSLREIIETICEFYKMKPNITVTNENPKYFKGSNKLFEETYEYSPKINFELGLIKTVKFTK